MYLLGVDAWCSSVIEMPVVGIGSIYPHVACCNLPGEAAGPSSEVVPAFWTV